VRTFAAMEPTRTRHRLRAVNVLLIVALLAIAGGAYLLLRDPGEAQAAASTTTTVQRGDVTATVSASGSILSTRTLQASFVAAGTVTEVLVAVGEHVTEHEVLAKLEDVAGDIVRLKAPMTGTVSDLSLAVGQTVGTTGDTSVSVVDDAASATEDTSTNSASVQVTNLSRLVVRAFFSETDVSKLKVGQRATVTIDALQTTVRAVVRSIDITSTENNNVVDYGVTLRLRKRPASVRSGQTATVEIVTQRAKDSLFVPSATVQTIGGSSFVTVMEDGQTTQVPVTIGVEGDQTTEIQSGLSEGDEVVIPSTTGAGGFPTGGFPIGGGAVGGPGIQIDGPGGG
jgi:HlyD family secretion protein